MVDKTRLAKAYTILGETPAPEYKQKAEKDLKLLIQQQANLVAEAVGKPTLDVDDIVKVMGISKSSAYRLVNSDRITTMTVGNRKIIAATTLAAALINGGKVV